MVKSFKIWIEDKKTFENVIKQMDKDGIRWYMSEDCASSHIDRHDVPIALFVDSDNKLSWGDDEVSFKDHEYSEITPKEYLKEDKTMTKADLKDWMIVEDNLDRRYIVDKVHGCFLQYNYTNNYISNMDNFNGDLHDSANGHYITKVFDPTINELSRILDGFSDVIPRDIIWEREEPAVEMTIAEIEEKLGIKNLKIVKENEDD